MGGGRGWVTQGEIRAAFEHGWRVEAIQPADIRATVRAEPARSWFATLART